MTSSCERWEGMYDENESPIRPMEYPVLQTAAWLAGNSLPEMAAPATALETKRAAEEEAFTRQLEAIRREAVEQGRKMAIAESTAWRQQRAAELTSAIEGFEASRDAYLALVEKEVVQLALAIAERILHRESQLDPLLLSGAVRMALGQLADSTEVHLRVPADQRELWTEAVHLMPGLPLRPQVIADAELRGGAAILESSHGTVDLSIRAQLEEIERGFFDRNESRSEGDHAPEAGRIPASRNA